MRISPIVAAALLAALAAGCAGTPELTGAAAARSRGADVGGDPIPPGPDAGETGGASGGAAPVRDPWLDDARVLAYVNGVAISLREVRHEMGRSYDEYLPRRDLLSQAVNARLGDLVVRRIVTAEAERIGLRIPDDMFERIVEEQGKEAAERGTTLEQYLRDVDITRREWEANLREKVLHQNALAFFLGEFAENQYSEDHFRPTVDTFVTPEEIRAYGERHPEIAAVPERATVRVVDVRVAPFAGEGTEEDAAWEACAAAAAAVAARLEAGADPADVVKEFPQGVNAASGGIVEDGQLRTLRREYRDWAYAEGRRTGDRSGPIRLPTGYLVLVMEEHVPAHRAPIEEWGPGVRARLENDKTGIAIRRIEIDLLERAAVSPPELKDALLRDRRAEIRRVREGMR